MSGIRTKADPTSARWRISDPVVRVRVMGAETCFPLDPAKELIIGTAETSDIRLADPKGMLSRSHARITPQDGVYTITDLESTNGIKVDGKVGKSFPIAPCDTVELGGCTLIAESERSIELHDLLRRLLGWSVAALVEADRALRVMREVAHLRAVLIMRGHGSLIGTARRLHEKTLGSERPFSAHDPKETGMVAQERAFDGTLFLDGEKLPRDVQPVLATLRLPDTRVRVIIGANTAEAAAEVATRINMVARLSIPSLSERQDELDRLLEAYGSDAMVPLGAPSTGLRPHDLQWIRKGGIKTLEEAEEIMLRVVAVRNWGVTSGAERLGITHGALSRYMRRHGIPT